VVSIGSLQACHIGEREEERMCLRYVWRVSTHASPRSTGPTASSAFPSLSFYLCTIVSLPQDNPPSCFGHRRGATAGGGWPAGSGHAQAAPLRKCGWWTQRSRTALAAPNAGRGQPPTEAELRDLHRAASRHIPPAATGALSRRLATSVAARQMSWERS
jgi:hypothetical protein